MALRVNTNVDALSIQNSMNKTNNKISESLQRLSSGKRINSAKDDASGLAVANSFKAKISSMRMASQNAVEANSMLQTADGAYSQIHDMLVRMKDLATQAASGQTEERAKLNTEFMALSAEIDRIAQSTVYGNLTLTGGGTTGQAYTFQIGVGTTDNDHMTVTFSGANTTALAINSNTIGGTNSTAASTSITALETALSSINTHMASVGAYQNKLQYTIDNLANSIENFSASESAIRDVDMAFEMVNFTKNQILQQSGMAMLAQANQAPQQVLQLLNG